MDWVLGALAEGVNVLRESMVNLYMPDGLSHSARCAPLAHSTLWILGAFVDWVLGALAEGVNVLLESTVNLYMPDGPSHSARCAPPAHSASWPSELDLVVQVSPP